MLLLLTQMGFFGEIHVFLQFSRIGLYKKREPIFTLKNLHCRNDSYKELTQFSLGNNMLDAAV
jgi:hypothetical protein